MPAHLDRTIKAAMQTCLDDFFKSLHTGGQALTSFIGNWVSFSNTIHMYHDSLNEETLLAVHGAASLVDAVASNMLELQITSEKITHENATDIVRILGEGMGELSLSENSVHYPAYVKPSYEWLLSNLHNPYPPKDVKKKIASRAKCPLKDIDSWFIDARKRIGWNTLRRHQFCNKQEKIIAAATQFFRPHTSTFSDDPNASLESQVVDDRYHGEFAAMEAAARSLYSGRFIDPSSINHHVKRKPPPLSEPSAQKCIPSPRFVNADGNILLSEDSLSKSIENPISFYPTPAPSPEQMAQSSPPPISFTYPMQATERSRKRRRSSVELPEEDCPTTSRKRHRSDANEVSSLGTLPSPAPNTTPSEGGSASSIVTKEPTTNPIVVSLSTSTKRKRRLSEGNDCRAAKRPHHALAVPRLQTVSDPFPIANAVIDDSFDDWFDGNFSPERRLSSAIPSPSSLKLRDLPDTVHLDVHCHEYGTFDISPYQSVVALPATPFTSNDDASIESFCSEISVPVELLEAFSHETQPLVDTGLGGNATCTVGAGEYLLPQDFDFQSSISQDDTVHPLDQILNFDSLVQASPLNFNWMQSPLGDPADMTEPTTSYIVERSLSDFDSSIDKGLVLPEDQDAKRLRLQFLREELKLLESELGP